MIRNLFLIVFVCAFSILRSQFPSLVWAKNQSGTFDDYNTGITNDPFGNIYISGYFQGTPDFDPGAATYTLTSNGGYDFFVSKLDPNGNFIWAKSVGGYSQDFGFNVTLDGLGNVLVCGYFQDTVDFDPGVGTYTLASNGSDDFFVLKLDALGNFLWAVSAGGPGKDWGYSLTTDALNNVYLVGNFVFTVDFDPGPGSYSISSNGMDDAFILKLNSLGNFIWAKQIGGSGGDFATAITFNNSGNIVMTGSFNGTVDFDPGPLPYTFLSAGLTDLFVLTLDLAGNFVWAKQVGSSNQDEGYAVKCDAMGNIIVSGIFVATADFDPGPATFNLSPIGTCDAFVLKLNSSGGFVWAINFGGPSIGISASALAIDAANNVYVDGNLNGTIDFDPGPGVYSLTALSNPDLYITALDPNGNFKWARSIGSTAIDYGFSINIDAFNNICLAMYSNGFPDFDPSPSTYTLSTTGAGSMDSYVIKWALAPTLIEDITNDKGFLLYPNPNNGTFQLSIEGEVKNGSIVLVNSLGQKIFEQNISKGINEIKTGELSHGLYNYILLSDKQKLKDGRLVVD